MKKIKKENKSLSILDDPEKIDSLIKEVEKELSEIPQKVEVLLKDIEQLIDKTIKELNEIKNQVE